MIGIGMPGREHPRRSGPPLAPPLQGRASSRAKVTDGYDLRSQPALTILVVRATVTTPAWNPDAVLTRRRALRADRAQRRHVQRAGETPTPVAGSATFRFRKDVSGARQ
jgi:hypothetical protein